MQPHSFSSPEIPCRDPLNTQLPVQAPSSSQGFCLHQTKPSGNQGRGAGGEGEEALFSFSNLILLKLHSKK